MWADREHGDDLTMVVREWAIAVIYPPDEVVVVSVCGHRTTAAPSSPAPRGGSPVRRSSADRACGGGDRHLILE